MHRRIWSLATAAVASLIFAPMARAQAHAPHLVIVQMMEKPNSRFAFEPAAVQVARGDTLRFEQTGTVPHDVDFKQWPKGAKLGSGELVPYLTSKGVTYDLVIDQRFPAGTYKFVCDPHEALGMAGTLTVDPSAQ